ncbi:PspC domain-containing protein [Carnobacterium divergens]|uniref:PspC domain-containing protein n=1 Tax=Carnobacterium divergens TaxID=2748 RepID=UPI0007F45B77|nr:PspC domain-containing protein [Carnobacterium divergens]MCO6018538.1 PspC domain-containing protein [Carnobacterium divergens]MPQ22275.1 PspC domain-containing protein [Carnobacterium divergens]TFI65143.1 PspC domain-containing protein [Carnobacterium divergens]TFI92033.1 PspC domain-containing protein [Carnobacterium divergens]TFJ07255.1 PspC domain-containing protein [Carnobacterium divergens]
MKKLTKSRKDRVLSGVLGGIAEYFGIDATILRIIFVVAAFFSFGSPVILYIILAICIPEPKRDTTDSNYGNRYYSTNYEDYHGKKKVKQEKRKEAEKVEDDDWSDF